MKKISLSLVLLFSINSYGQGISFMPGSDYIAVPPFYAIGNRNKISPINSFIAFDDTVTTKGGRYVVGISNYLWFNFDTLYKLYGKLQSEKLTLDSFRPAPIITYSIGE